MEILANIIGGYVFVAFAVYVLFAFLDVPGDSLKLAAQWPYTLARMVKRWFER